jgi:hypothetical protein
MVCASRSVLLVGIVGKIWHLSNLFIFFPNSPEEGWSRAGIEDCADCSSFSVDVAFFSASSQTSGLEGLTVSRRVKSKKRRGEKSFLRQDFAGENRASGDRAVVGGWKETGTKKALTIFPVRASSLIWYDRVGVDLVRKTFGSVLHPAPRLPPRIYTPNLHPGFTPKTVSASPYFC